MQIRKLSNVVAVAAVLATSPTRVLAWGDQAHRIICAIAMREMSESSRREVNRLIAMDEEFSNFAESCVWADHLRDKARRRGGPDARAHEHYINVARTTTKIRTDTCTLADECLFSALKSDEKILSDRRASDADRLAALKFLGHWIGDIHQPFHVSYADDRGGNSIDTKGECSSNLHAAWDQCLVHKRFRVGDAGKIAQKLASGITDEQRRQWTAVPPASWADESYQIVTSPAVKYCVEHNGTCRYSARELELSPHKTHKIVAIGPDYIETYGPVVEVRLQQAGERLANVLDRLLGSH